VPEIYRARMSKTSITEEHEEPTIASALAVSPRFGVKPTESKKILSEVFSVVSTKPTNGRQLRHKAATLDACASALANQLMDEVPQLYSKSLHWWGIGDAVCGRTWA